MPLPRSAFVVVVVVVRLCFCFFVFSLAILLLDFCGLSARSHIKIDWIPVKLISQVNAAAHSPPLRTPLSLAPRSEAEAEAVVNYAPRLVFYIKRQTPAPEIATVYWSGLVRRSCQQTGVCRRRLLALPGSVKIFDHLGSHGIYFALTEHISAAFYLSLDHVISYWLLLLAIFFIFNIFFCRFSSRLPN